MESIVSCPNESSDYIGSVRDRLTKWASEDPNKTALVCVDANGKRESLTTSDMLRNSLSFASYLMKNGINHGDAVVICMKRSIQSVIAFNGTCCAGAVCYMLNDVSDRDDVLQLLQNNDNVKGLCVYCETKSDGEELVEIVLRSKEQTALNVVITNDDVKQQSTLSVSSMSDILNGKACEDIHDVKTDLSKESNVVFFKEANVTSENDYVGCTADVLFGAACDVIKRLGITRKSVCFSDERFEHALCVLRSYIVSGCTHIFVEDAVKHQTNFADKVFEVLRTEGCTHAFVTSHLLGQMLQHEPKITTIESLICYSDRLPVKKGRLLGSVTRTMTRLYEYRGVIPISLMSASNIDSLAKDVIGQPLPGVTMKVTDEKGQITARKIPGSLYIQTQYKLNDKLGSSPTEDWIKTGYIGRICSDGNAELIGRESDQITIGTKRFFANQVEDIILQCPGVHSVIVLPIQNRKMQNLLCACLIVEKEFDMDFLETFCDGIWSTSNSLTSSCQKPNHFVPFNKFPRTLDGQNDKEMLKRVVRDKLWPGVQSPVRFF